MRRFWGLVVWAVDRLDAGYAWLWHRVLVALCWTTGKDNFFFARLVVKTGAVLSFGYLAYALPVVWRAPWPLRAVALAAGVAMAGGTIMVARGCLAVISDVECATKAWLDDGLLLLPPEHWRDGRAWDVSFAVLVLFNPWLVQLPARGVAYYFMWDYQPPRRGRVRRALTRLRDQLAVRPLATPSPA